jgi:hypothetical protein
MTKRRTAAAETSDEQAPENTTPAEGTNASVGNDVDPFSGQPSSESAGPEGQEQAAGKPFNPVRGWRHRNNEPRYQVLTDSRIKKIIIKFPLAQGQQAPSAEILAVMREHKKTPDGNATGLRFEDSRLHGKVWTLPNDQEGRAELAAIEIALEKIATKAPSGPKVGA